MAFANLILLAGAALVAVPILLHLLMRQQPRKIIFPALRFVKQRQIANRRRLRFRHLLLLAARCLAILLLVLAVARPSIAPESVDQFVASSAVGGLALVALLGVAAAYWLQNRRWVLITSMVIATLLVLSGAAMAFSWLGDRDESNTISAGAAPVAVALVFDTSPRMTYKQDSRDRLDVAREFGQWVVGELPGESEIAVLNSRSDSSAFAIDRGAAEKKIESLRPTSAGLPLPTVVTEGIDRVRESQLEHREVYVFTDLANASWPAEETQRLAQRLSEATDVQLYLIDVGVERPLNMSLGDLNRFTETVADGDSLTLRLDVTAVGMSGSRTVELHEYLAPEAGTSVKPDERKTRIRARRNVEIKAGEGQQVELIVSGLGKGTTQGFLQLVGEDGLAWDDRRYFTVAVAPAQQILLASPKPVDDYTTFLAAAIAPRGLKAGGRFECEITDLDQLAQRSLEDLQSYAAVCVLDPTASTPKLWTLLSDYARLGGGVGVFLGRNAGGNVRHPVEEFNEAAKGLLPAPLVRIRSRAAPPFQLVTDRRSDTILSRLSDYVVPWSAYPVYKFWELGPLPRGVRVAAGFDTGHPAIVDQPLGNGRVVWVTTPVSDPASIQGHWNLLPTADPPWPFLALADGIMSHLAASGSQQYNYITGQTAVVEVDRNPADGQSGTSSDAALSNVVVTTPLGDDLTLRPDARQKRLFFRGTELPGSYRATAGGTSDRFETGFSVNSPAAESDLTRVAADQLRETLGRPKLQIARDRGELTRDIARGRIGVKLFPWVMVGLAAIMVLEVLMSTLFYRPPLPAGKVAALQPA